jgi:NAD(P)H dehydrogenase (quinone)
VEFLEVEDQPVEELRPAIAPLRLAEGEGEMRRRRDALLQRLAAADALIVGAPAYFGSLASPLKRFFEDCATASTAILDRSRPWHHYLFRDKPGAAFTSSATPHGGNEQALHSMLTMLMHLGLIVVTPGQRGPILERQAAPYGATAITGPTGHRGLTEAEAEEARYLGERVATVATWLRLGRGEAERRRLEEGASKARRGFDPSA